MTSPIPCTVQLLTRNNAAGIGRCLDSLRDFAEVIVQDGGSTDGTRDIAQRYPNVRLMDQKPALLNDEGRITDFAAMRNESISAATHDWIFVVDGDESTAPALTEEIRRIVEANVPGVYQAFRRFIVGGEPVLYCAGYPALQIRLFHRSLTDGYRKPVHERLQLKPGVEMQLLKEELPVPLPPARDLLAKNDRYLAMELRRLGVIPYGRWFRWVLYRNLRSVAGLLVRDILIALRPKRGKAMPFIYDWLHIRHLLRLIHATFPPVATQRLRAIAAEQRAQRPADAPQRVLVLTPWVPWPVTGADQQERWTGYKHFQALGCELSILAKIHAFQSQEEVTAAFREAKLPLQLFDHPRRLWPIALQRFPRILRTPALLDGAAMEYIDPAYERVVCAEVERFKPDVIWIEYSTQWPLLRTLKPYGIPCIIRSHNNEAYNCIDEHGGTLLARLKALPKFAGERIAARECSLMAAITPVEADWYTALGGRQVRVLPLRGLADVFAQRTHTEKDVLDVVFLSSNYNMRHNRDAMRFIAMQVIPRLRERAPGRFRFHFTGKKFPDADRSLLASDVRATGFVPDIHALLDTMDIALCPWITGQGMQQKVFEPLCRSLPLITTKTGGYPFENGKDVLLAASPEDYVAALLELRSATRRQELADAAYAKAHGLFSEETLLATLRDLLTEATHHTAAATASHTS